MKHPLYALLLLPLAAVLWWVLGGARAATGMGFAPVLPEAVFSPAEYDAGTVFDYMNGAAEHYLRHGFKALKVWTGKAGETEVTVELYLVDSPPNARLLYERARGGEETTVDGTPVAVGSGAGAACAGKFFLRVYTYPERDEVPRQILNAFARWYRGQNR
jgi:hypothetical protein